MQLREILPYDIRQVMASLPIDGEVRHKYRNFTINTRVGQRARSVKEFVESLGFDVKETDFPRGMNGKLVADTWSASGYRIEINKRLSVEAKRFAVLHELGHYVRHVDSSDPLGDDRHFDLGGSVFYVNDAEETEANEFAEALLFGGGQLTAAHSLFGGDLNKLSRYFGVTQPVVRIAVDKVQR